MSELGRSIDSQAPFLLAERARSEGARSMRAVKGDLGYALSKNIENRKTFDRQWHVSMCRFLACFFHLLYDRYVGVENDVCPVSALALTR